MTININIQNTVWCPVILANNRSKFSLNPVTSLAIFFLILFIYFNLV